ncbi:tetratricopeptide repeat protein [Pajaroellobacter abortibovis]|uniref:Uncharacterized protein n=1 Tax=Pajaroellobacter abortibovis TaxID=1882918 RepID=A0A1L6MWT4_9BACT|nr:hypothetical protein [Pajaroellobacter abortibovis]APS00003.1 hypothetical protein BCY86_04360 [Pajaroellobacter abortibovis]
MEIAKARIARTKIGFEYAVGQGNLEIKKAVRKFQKSIELDLQNGMVFLRLGWALLLLGQEQDQLKSVQHAEGLLPSEVEVDSALGVAWMVVGNIDQSIGSFRQSAERDLNNPDKNGSLRTALLIGQGQRFDEAEKEFREQIVLSPDHTCSSQFRGYVDCKREYATGADRN